MPPSFVFCCKPNQSNPSEKQVDVIALFFIGTLITTLLLIIPTFTISQATNPPLSNKGLDYNKIFKIQSGGGLLDFDTTSKSGELMMQRLSRTFKIIHLDFTFYMHVYLVKG